MGNDSEFELLTPAEVADMLLVSPVTVRQWSQRGELPAQMTPGGHRRYTLKAVRQFAEKRGLQINQSGAEGASRLRVLIVEDDVQLREFLVELLSDKPGVLVATANSAFQAGRELERFAPDLVLLDLMLPGIDGVQICHELKAVAGSQNIRVLAMTGYYSEDNVARILQAGAEVCLRKPLNIPHLLSACGLGEG